MKKTYRTFQENLFKSGEEVAGFLLEKEEFIEEVDGFARSFKHIKTGARCFYLSSEDDNKVFSISFKTPSSNSTGVAHILEHSVLCGSKKYPVKEPFVELAKGSLNTFLNAMTFPDKTMYPVASTNAQDFMNLIDVYLDAVFYPNIYQDPYTFYQEGWHYHIEKPEDEINYNGVVYNEMKGAFSNPEEVLQNKIFESLYPETAYRFESGGDPEVIPDLSYEAFIDFHKKYYHPSNSYIYIYGDGDVLEHLSYLNAEYLDQFEKREIDSRISSQKPFKERVDLKGQYGISTEETEENKAYMAYSFVLGEKLSYEKAMAFEILAHILLNNNSSPLKEALLKLDIAEDISYHYSSSLKQPYFSIILKNTDEKHGELFLTTVEKVLKQLIENGLDPKDVEAGVNIHEFSHIEGETGSYPKGLIYGIDIMDSWLYGGQPGDYLKYRPVFKAIKAGMKKNYFEKMIKELLIDNAHQSLVTILPDKNYQEKADQAMAEKMTVFKDKLGADELAKLVDQTNLLIKKQNAEDQAEDLEKIPKLALADIDKEAKIYPLKEESAFGSNVLFHEGFTGDIVYLKLYFNFSEVKKDDLKYLSLLCKLLGNLSTKKSDYRLLNQEIEINTGGISFGLESYQNTKDLDDYQSFCYLRGKAVSDKIPQLSKLIEEILTQTKYTEKHLIRDMIREIKTKKETQFLTAGHVVGVHRLQSYYSQSARLFEEFGGIEFYRFLVDLDENFEARFDQCSKKLKEIGEKVFLSSQPIVSITGSTALKTQTLEHLQAYLRQLRPAEITKPAYDFDLEIKNEGFMTPAKIQYVSQGYNFRKLGYPYSGSLLVLKSILSMDYLWNKIRVQGGAYGAFMNAGPSGDLYFGSYRDPKLTKTFEAIEGVVAYIKELKLSQRELEKYIIGTISSKDVPLSLAMKGEVADNLYFSKVSDFDKQKEREEILATNQASLKEFEKMLEDVLKQKVLCVLGNEEIVKKESHHFKEVRTIK